MGSSSPHRDENKEYLSCHHLVNRWISSNCESLKTSMSWIVVQGVGVWLFGSALPKMAWKMAWSWNNCAMKIHPSVAMLGHLVRFPLVKPTPTEVFLLMSLPDKSQSFPWFFFSVSVSPHICICCSIANTSHVWWYPKLEESMQELWTFAILKYECLLKSLLEDKPFLLGPGNFSGANC